MTYNASKGKELESLKPGIVGTAIITVVNDGKVADFLSEEAKAKWANPLQSAIEISAEHVVGEEKYTDTRIFPYKTDDEGFTVFTGRSNLGKFFKYYKKLPEVGDQVQMKTNADGYFKIVIE